MQSLKTIPSLLLVVSFMAVGTALAVPTVQNATAQNAASQSDGQAEDVSVVETSSEDAPLAAETSESELEIAQADPSVDMSSDVNIGVAPSTVPMRFVLGSGDATMSRLPALEGNVIVIRDGSVIGEFPIGPGGIVQFPTVPSGIYTLVLRGEMGFAAVGTFIRGVDDKHFGKVNIRIAAAPGIDFPAFEALLLRAGQDQTPLPLGRIINFDPDSRAILNDDAYDAFYRDADSIVAIQLLELMDETTKARTAPGMAAYLLKDGKIVSRTIADQDGLARLSVGNVGRYSLVVTGPDRFLVMSVFVQDVPNADVFNADSVSLIRQFVFGQVSASLNMDEQSVGNANVVPNDDSSAASNSLGVGNGGPSGAGAGPGAGAGGGGIGGGGIGGGGTGGGGGGIGGGGGGGAIGPALLGLGAGVAAGLAAGGGDTIVSPAGP